MHANSYVVICLHVIHSAEANKSEELPHESSETEDQKIDQLEQLINEYVIR